MDKITHNDVVVAILLNNTMVIDESTFNKLEGSTRGSILTANKASSFDFKPNFNHLKNVKDIAARLSQGEDVTFELGYHDIEVPTDLMTARQAYLDLLNPILDQLKSMTPPYPFAEPDGNRQLTLSGNRVTNGAHRIGLATAQKIWGKASRKWVDPNNFVASHDVSADGYTRDVRYHDDRIEIGCQTISRYQVEQFALDQGWEFPIAD